MRYLAWRIPLMALSIAGLLGALWAGLVRIGWAWPVGQPALPLAHGPLMVSGFLGSLIALERAVALGRPWAYLPPAVTGLGGVLLMLGAPVQVGAALITLGSLGLVNVFIHIVRSHPALYTRTMFLGAACWAVGNLFWFFGWPVYHIVSWWSGFLVLTIAGERLELGRLIRLPRSAETLFLAAMAVYLLGLVVRMPAFGPGTRLAGAGMLALAAWLLRFDIARHTIRKPGLPRFAAAALLGGYAWLGLGGALALYGGGTVAGFAYDAELHAVFVGFVFSMIFGHAPIIFPSVLGLPVAFHARAYLPLALLHASLAARILGDFAGWVELRRWGGLLNALAILLYLGFTLVAVLQAKRADREPQGADGPTGAEAPATLSESQ